jgi:signal transduction histidine kinase
MSLVATGQWRAARLSAGYAAFCVLGIALYFTLPFDLGNALVYDAIAVTSAVAIVAGVRLYRPANALPWLLIAAGIGSFAAGEITWDVYYYALEQDPFPSAADGFYLAGYPLIAAGLYGLARAHGAGRAHTRASTVDSAIVAVAGSVAIWVFLVDPSSGDSSWPLADRLLSAGYPLMDILLLTLLVRLLFAPGAVTVALYLLAAGISLNIAGDLGYLAVQVSGSSWETTPLAVFWLLSYAAVGAAALHPTMAKPITASGKVEAGLTRSRLAVLTLAAVAAPAVLALDAFYGEVESVTAVVVGAAALALLVLVRLAGLVRELERSAAAREALFESERAALLEAESARRLLLEQNDRLREVDRLKDEFVALVSHELRTPLTSISGYLELVLDDPELSEEHRRFLDVVDRNADRLLRLVGDLLLVAQIDSGRLVLDLDDADVRAVAAEAVEDLRPTAEGKNVHLRLDSRGRCVVRGDGPRLRQLLANLVSNAVKFTPEGGKVRVSVEQRGDEVALAVSDTGIGIPVAEQRRLFDRFFRASSAQKHAIDGTGLGLTIARAITEAHGGTIGFTSAEDAGTTFEVRLPQAGPVEEPAATDTADARSAGVA